MADFNAVWERPENLPSQGRDRRPERLGHPRPSSMTLDPAGRRGPSAPYAAALADVEPATSRSSSPAAGAPTRSRCSRPPSSRRAASRGGSSAPPSTTASRTARPSARARWSAQMAALGVDETVAVRVRVEASGQGPEAAAREARYAVLEEVAERFGAPVVLLGHTLDDQAETVLLGLTRGSGGRSLAGMRPAFDRFRRPLLDVTRAETEAACRPRAWTCWTDPHNADPAFTRVPGPHRRDAGARARARPGRRRDPRPHRQPAPGRRRSRSTPSPRRRTTSSRPTASCPSAGWRPCPTRCGCACSGWPPCAPVRSPATSATATSSPSTSWSAAGAASSGSTCPGGSARSAGTAGWRSTRRTVLPDPFGSSSTQSDLPTAGSRPHGLATPALATPPVTEPHPRHAP